MDILQKVLELDFAYLETFTNRLNTSWGCLFYNVDQPNYYDANHAHVESVGEDPKTIISEVIDFYKQKNIIPRFYLYNASTNKPLTNELKASGFQMEELVNPVQLWNKEVSVQKGNSLITIEKVTNENFQEALEIECSIKELGGRSVREKAFPVEFNHPAYTHYLLKYDGTACSTACIFEDGNQARLESVATLEEYRGKGLIGELIYHIQQEVSTKGFENLWVFPINERVERVYQRYGFETVGKIKVIHAFMGGKSITEIQQNP